jgi:transcriptional regulator with PAS, ATPase and Fis domain
MHGSDETILKLKRDILRLKGTDAYVLITGENGTGKELVARGLNLQEDDTSRPFVAVNCAAIPATLFESEFFGHVKGAFTGATENKIGQFKAADGGDIFLDEIGEVPLPMQAKLLRVLQEKIFTPVGGIKPVSIDVRVIAATNRNLEEEIAKGNFREDLYYRLTKIVLRTPPLRERQSDIIPLAEEFLKRLLPVARLSEPAKKALLSHPWRGNIRELQNTIERASVFMKDSNRPILKPEHLGLIPSPLHHLAKTLAIPERLLPQNKQEVSSQQRQRALDWIDRIYWERALKVTGENRTLYSLLGVSKTYYYERKKELFAESETAEGTEA